MEVMLNFSIKEDNEIKIRRLVVVVSSFLIVATILTTGVGPSSPVIIDEDSYGSWEDSFEDSNGIESFENVTIDSGDIKLATDASASVINWDHYYPADLEPEDSGWLLVTDAVGDLASASGGTLFLDTTSEDAQWWYDIWWGASNAVGATFEVRLKVESSSEGLKIILYDGSYYEGIHFYPNRIRMFIDSSEVYFMDTTDTFHTYRFTVKGNDYMVYVDGILRIDGTGLHTEPNINSACRWGDTANDPGYTSISEWDFVRYNISGAFLPDQPGKYTIGNLPNCS